jgi:hypothetical protein
VRCGAVTRVARKVCAVHATSAVLARISAARNLDVTNNARVRFRAVASKVGKVYCILARSTVQARRLAARNQRLADVSSVVSSATVTRETTKVDRVAAGAAVLTRCIAAWDVSLAVVAGMRIWTSAIER